MALVDQLAASIAKALGDMVREVRGDQAETPDESQEPGQREA